MSKYIFITGGVTSSLGKGITAASIGVLLQSCGYSVRLRKLDPYLNIDPGTMSPYQHGEVFVTSDGAETDLDIGHYERFTNTEADKNDSCTAGKIYHKLLHKERRGDYLGKTVQVIPHVTDLIKEVVKHNPNCDDFIICEVGGTVGDIEGLPFYDAIRQLKNDVGRENILYIHLTYVPYISTSKELKSKPTQHSVNTLRSIGIQPDILILRSDRKISEDLIKKISMFCDVEKDAIIGVIDQKTIYNVPIALQEEGIGEVILNKLNLKSITPRLDEWDRMISKINNSNKSITIAIVGKYSLLEDAYTSLIEALNHASILKGYSIKIRLIDSRAQKINSIESQMQNVSAVIVPGGFGSDGIGGKIDAIDYARKNNIPFLGICYGMQLAAIYLAKEILNINDACSSEFNKDCTKIIALLEEWSTDSGSQVKIKNEVIGGSMRLGDYRCKLKPGSKIKEIYDGAEFITERHRHRYEFNSNYIDEFERRGISISGKSADGNLVEIIELLSHKWFIGVQFHPEFKSRLLKPHPLFRSFIDAAISVIDK